MQGAGKHREQSEAHVRGQEGSRSERTEVLVGKTHQQGPQGSNPEAGVEVRRQNQLSRH